MNQRRAVVTGMGWATSLGLDVPAVWTRLLAGTNGVKTISRFDTSKHSIKIGGEISDWDGGGRISPRDLKRLDRFAQFAVASAIDAIEYSGLDFDTEDLDRCGVIIGSGIGGIEEFEKGYAKMIDKGPDRVSPFMIPKLMINAASANVSMLYGLQGVNTAAVTACASGGHAIVDAVKAIVHDEADVVITGGAEAALTPLGLACFMTMRALSNRNDDPQHASRPWDRDRDGFILSEGAGVIVLEDYDHARQRGADILAEIVGYGMTADAGHITQPDDQGTGASKAMAAAVRSANLALEDVSYINAHGTSAPLGDTAENNAVKNLFGDHAYKLALNSTKSMMGHLLGASGGVEAIITIQALRTGDLPPTTNLDNPDDGCDLDYIANQAQHRDITHAMSNSFGFGGHNVSLVFSQI